MSRLTVRKSNLALAAYLALCLVIFGLLVRPSLEGKLDLRMTADAGTYVALVKVLAVDPRQLITVGANYLGPFLLLGLTRSDPLAIVVINCGLFLFAYRSVVRTFDLDRRRLVPLLCLNPMLGFSLLAINKEILGFACAAFMACYLEGGRRRALAAALVLSLMTRWQMTLVILLMLLVRSRLNPFARHRTVTLVSMVGVVTVLYPTVLRRILAPALEGEFITSQLGSTAGLTAVLAAVQDHYGYFLVLIPKLVLSYFGNLLRLFDFVVRPGVVDYSDVYNNVAVLGHQVSMVLVFWLALQRRRLTLASDNMFFLAVYSVVFGISVLISYRYFFPLYLLVCIDLCRRAPSPLRAARNATAEVGPGAMAYGTAGA